MSGGGWKEPLYKLVKQDSRNAAWLGNALGWDFLEQEGKHNTENPGRAVTKAAEYALGGYLGGLYGGLYDGAGAYAAATPGLTASGEQAAMLASQTGEFGLDGLAKTAASGGNPYASALTKMVSGSGTSAGGKQLAMQMGMQSLQPQQPQPMGAPPPRQQGPQEPLANPYSSSFPTNGLLSMQEIERRKRLGLLGMSR